MNAMTHLFGTPSILSLVLLACDGPVDPLSAIDGGTEESGASLEIVPRALTMNPWPSEKDVVLRNVGASTIRITDIVLTNDYQRPGFTPYRLRDAQTLPIELQPGKQVVVKVFSQVGCTDVDYRAELAIDWDLPRPGMRKVSVTTSPCAGAAVPLVNPIAGIERTGTRRHAAPPAPEERRGRCPLAKN